MGNTRVLAVNLSHLLSGVMSELMSGHPGLELVGDVSADELLEAIALFDPDVVALGIEDGADVQIALVQRLHPRLSIVAIDAEGSATAHQPGQPARRVNNISPANLFDMLRTGPTSPGVRLGRSH